MKSDKELREIIKEMREDYNSRVQKYNTNKKMYEIFFDFLHRAKRSRNICETCKLIEDAVGQMKENGFANDSVVKKVTKLKRIDAPQLNSKIYFTISEDGVFPCVVIDGSYISDCCISNQWTWINLKNQTIQKGEGRFYELVGIPQIGTNQTKEGNEKQFLLDSFGLAE